MNRDAFDFVIDHNSRQTLALSTTATIPPWLPFLSFSTRFTLRVNQSCSHPEKCHPSLVTCRIYLKERQAKWTLLRSLEKADDSCSHHAEDLFAVIFLVGFSASCTIIIVDNGEKHTQTDKDHNDDVESKSNRSEHRSCIRQFMRVELQQWHFEQHSSCGRQRCTGGYFGNEEEVEEAEKSDEDERKHEWKGYEFRWDARKRASECRQVMVILTELKKS